MMPARHDSDAAQMKLIEIRTYQLKPGYAEQFVEAFNRALPLVRESMDVVAFGRSDHERESFYLIRAYDSREALEKQQGTFYSSEAWRNGPRRALVECIEHYLNTLVWMSASAVEDLRTNNVHRSA
jgi:quinol monooxygenase YgiN